jgi:PAS domain S-box-containing protein
MFLVLLVATCLMLFIAYLSFRKRQLSIAKYSALVMLCASFYSLGYAFEIISSDLESVKFWLKVEYVGIPFISTLWLILVIHFTAYQAFLKKWVVLLLFGIPVLTLLLHYTNDIHHFFYRDIQLDKNTSDIYATQLLKGPWYWVHISYNYLQAVVGMILFVSMYLKAIPIVRKQIIILMLGAAAPWLSNIIYLFGDFGNLDLTPLGFCITGITFIWGIYQFNLLRLAPIALQTVFETMQDGVIILDYDNNITNANQAAKDICRGLNRLQNKTSASDIFPNEPELLSKIRELENSETNISIRKEKDIRYYNVKISIIYDKGHIQLGKTIIFSDITQITIYQEKLLASATQLAELNAFKDKLFTVVAHDIRDPLAVLVNLTELLEEELVVLESAKLPIFQEVSEQVRNTFLLVENLLEWFRSQKGKIIFSPLVWNLAPIMKKVVDSVKVRSEMKEIHISFNVDNEQQVFVDKEMVEMVLRNLLSNAVKFTGIGGNIHVEATVLGETVTVSVRDSGVGVDNEIGKSLFHEIQQVSDSGTEGEKGSGLGLFLAGKFVLINGGQIWFEAIQGQGSTFYLTLPTTERARARNTKMEEELKVI